MVLVVASALPVEIVETVETVDNIVVAVVAVVVVVDYPYWQVVAMS